MAYLISSSLIEANKTVWNMQVNYFTLQYKLVNFHLKGFLYAYQWEVTLQ